MTREISPADIRASPHTRGWTPLVQRRRADDGGFPAHAGMDPTRTGRRRRSRRLPRTRGDGPPVLSTAARGYRASPHTRGWTVICSAGYGGVKASPHTRGWTLRTAQSCAGDDGFPAHAGMDPRCCPPRPAGTGLPRTRGDGPRSSISRRRATSASPHTRGWTGGQPLRAEGRRGFPAHAGMDPPRATRQTGAPRLPRTRGDGPAAADLDAALERASPHTRGWTRVDPRPRRPDVGFPAHAGMDPIACCGGASTTGLPRTRGDGPHRRRRHLGVDGASPHTRGWTRSGGGGVVPPAGFPAHAGMDPRYVSAFSSPKWLPRTRGDGPEACNSRVLSIWASPHTRGWTPRLELAGLVVEGFPAHAGMDRARRRAAGGRGRLPRTRGDGP